MNKPAVHKFSPLCQWRRHENDDWRFVTQFQCPAGSSDDLTDLYALHVKFCQEADEVFGDVTCVEFDEKHDAAWFHFVTDTQDHPALIGFLKTQNLITPAFASALQRYHEELLAHIRSPAAGIFALFPEHAAVLRPRLVH